MSLNGAGLFLLSLLILSFFYITFNSDVFIESTLSGFDALSVYNANGGYTPTFAGELVILLLILTFYTTAYILLINLI
jgi:hypothetical protein